MAEAVFAHMVRQNGLEASFARIDSAGTGGWHAGETPDSRSAKTCAAHGVPVNHRARQVTKSDFAEFDYMLCMDESNFENLKRMSGGSSKAKIHLFGEFDPNGERIIEDPYYGGIDGFEHNFQQVERASRGFLKHLGLL
nr:hypothetical protein HK105_007851 [Polyrhizophydium stewartii]